MTGLLVSVRDRLEAELALAAGADLIDLKEPAAGSLGAVSLPVMHDVAVWLAGRRPLSVALGELATLDPRLPGAVPAHASYAKLGLAACAGRPDWEDGWRGACQRLPAGVAPVAVAYADWIQAAAPAPQQVLATAARANVRVLLLDTFHKQSGNLFDLWPLDELRLFAAAVRRQELKLVLGGSLNLATIPTALKLEPDYIAVRGAVCRPSRSGRLDPQLLSQVRAAVSSNAPNELARARR
ncbi:MAG TPA: (5-formylfuran-3-yl)methyl phosphate synthase [Pirellulales bacterium]